MTQAESSRGNRVPIMFSDEEISEIDDWRFANRVATRSEAIRQLIKLGIAHPIPTEPVERKAIEAAEQMEGAS